MSNEEKKENKDKEEWGCLFIIAIGLGIGFYFAKTFYPVFDFEKKEYKPIILNDNLYLINTKNGKTYLLKENKTPQYSTFKYLYLTKPKSKEIHKINNDSFQNEIDREIEKRKLKEAGFSDEDINEYINIRFGNDPLGIRDNNEVKTTENGTKYRVLDN